MISKETESFEQLKQKLNEEKHKLKSTDRKIEM
ncbi:MAG: hypothetical protein Ta2E_11230 [Mycoplasmoidaceae bacterium]|nr:MAG: hypothetical protein Ta2E_11230 [Mycoplasmoidaceae bacterium]